MVKIYLKQAWVMLKQNKLFSALYIVGTGLAIAMTMVMAIVYYARIAPIYPETNRMNTLYLKALGCEMKNRSGDRMIMKVSYSALQEWLYPLKHAEAVSAAPAGFGGPKTGYIQLPDRRGDFKVVEKLTDPAFFRIYSFHFLEGKPFTQADWESGLFEAVITDDVARRLFGTTENVVGRSFSLDYDEFRVCGVVRTGSCLMDESYAQIYMPYTIDPTYKRPSMGKFGPYVGDYAVTFLVKNAKEADALREELNEWLHRQNMIADHEYAMRIGEQPYSHLATVFKEKQYEMDEWDAWQSVRYFLLLLLVLLLVPALNLNGMIASRMESRLSEMGLRKAFGAGRGRLLSQVIWENLLLTMLGGLLGLLLAWLFVYVGREWMFVAFRLLPKNLPDGVELRLSGEMLFAPVVFLSALLLCLLLNLLSALLPTWHSLRHPIVSSLHEKR